MREMSANALEMLALLFNNNNNNNNNNIINSKNFFGTFAFSFTLSDPQLFL